MTKQEKETKKENDLNNEMEQDLQQELNDTEKELDYESEKEEEHDILEKNDWNDETLEKIEVNNDEISKLKDAFARQQADFSNFKMRVDRDKDDMIFFLKLNILKKVLPRIDDMQRIILATPEEQRIWAIYEWIVSIEKKLTQDLEKMWVKAFVSKWEKIDPLKHEVMTQIPGENWIIIDEFEKWYMIWDRVLRVSKVVVGQG